MPDSYPEPIEKSVQENKIGSFSPQQNCLSNSYRGHIKKEWSQEYRNENITSIDSKER